MYCTLKTIWSINKIPISQQSLIRVVCCRKEGHATATRWRSVHPTEKETKFCGDFHHQRGKGRSVVRAQVVSSLLYGTNHLSSLFNIIYCRCQSPTENVARYHHSKLLTTAVQNHLSCHLESSSSSLSSLLGSHSKWSPITCYCHCLLFAIVTACYYSLKSSCLAGYHYLRLQLCLRCSNHSWSLLRTIRSRRLPPSLIRVARCRFPLSLLESSKLFEVVCHLFHEWKRRKGLKEKKMINVMVFFFCHFLYFFIFPFPFFSLLLFL